MSDIHSTERIAPRVGDSRGENRLEILAARLSDPDAEVRSKVVTALGDLGDVRAADRLIASLKDRDNSVRISAALALGKLGDRRAVGPLIEASQDFNSRLVRESCCIALGELRDPAAIEALADYLAPRKLKSWVDENTAYEAARKVLHDQPVAALLALFESDRLLRNRVAAERAALLGRLCMLAGDRGDPGAVPALIQALHTATGATAARAANALGVLHDSHAVGPLLERIHDPEEEVRRSVCEALGKLRDPRVLDALVERLTDKDAKVRSAACAALGALGDKRAMAPLSALLDESLDAAKWACEAIAMLDADAARPAALAIGVLEGREEARATLKAEIEAGDLTALPLLLKHWQQHHSERARKALLVVSETLDRISAEALCANCLTGLRSVRLGTRQDSQLDWFTCRTCGRLPEKLIVGVCEIVAVLDEGAAEEISFADGTLRVYWLQRRASCDFDRVEVISVRDVEVDVFCQDVGGAMAALHSTLPKRIQCTIAPQCTLSRNSLKNLKTTFGPIVGAEDGAHGTDSRGEEKPQSGGWLRKLFK